MNLLGFLGCCGFLTDEITTVNAEKSGLVKYTKI